jgi:hypothetical protein
MVGEQAFEVRWATLLVVEMTSQMLAPLQN